MVGSLRTFSTVQSLLTAKAIEEQARQGNLADVVAQCDVLEQQIRTLLEVLQTLTA